MGIDGLLRYVRKGLRPGEPMTYGFFCPKTKKVWISVEPDRLVALKGGLAFFFGSVPLKYYFGGIDEDESWFEADSHKLYWEPMPLENVSEEYLWE